MSPVVADAADRVDAAGARPPLKWAGGKRWQVKHVLPYWERPHRRLVEPFAGGLAVAFRLGPRRALLNDVNPHLINFYQWLKRGRRSLSGSGTTNVRYHRARRASTACWPCGGARDS